MPIYAYSCATCGSFDVWRPAVEASEGLDCPTCGTGARRCYTPPGVAGMPRPLFRAREREEKSGYAPEVVATKSGRPMPHGIGHSHAH